MSRFADFFLNLDRRWIFLLIGLVVLYAVLFPFQVPGIKPTEPVRNYHRAIEELPEGAPILISADFDPGSKPELYPMLEATLRHAFRKKLRVVVMTLWLTGTGMIERALKTNVEFARDKLQADPRDGRDYVFLGWKPGNAAVVIGMGGSISEIYPTDTSNRKTGDLPVMAGIRTLKDFRLVVSISAGSPGFKEWIQYGQQKHQFTFNGGCTGIIIPEAYPYMDAGQMKGLLGALKGAAEYESLIEVPGVAMGGMLAISLAHFTMILLIAACNLLYVASGRWRRP
jgi:hypothetical protein